MAEKANRGKGVVVRRQEAETRNSAWASMTFEAQLADLDKRFGKGKGATKQREKIAARIALRDSQPAKDKSKAKRRGKTAKA